MQTVLSYKEMNVLRSIMHEHFLSMLIVQEGAGHSLALKGCLLQGHLNSILSVPSFTCKNICKFKKVFPKDPQQSFQSSKNSFPVSIAFCNHWNLSTLSMCICICVSTYKYWNCS